MERTGKRKYVNEIPTPMGMNPRALWSMLRDSLKQGGRRRPDKPMPALKPAFIAEAPSEGACAYWFGHSAFLLEIEGKRLLFDPMLANSPSPVPAVGGKRYGAGPAPTPTPEELPPLDAVVLSHDHYDHLHRGTVLRLRERTKRFFAPRGVGARLIRWGIDPKAVTELDWGGESEADGLQLICQPARHFSGRGPFDRNTTLWCSWVVLGRETRVFYSGDGGYGPHFKRIGDAYGPFDLTLMECGQYDARWAGIHMLPEETVQAQLDVRGRLMIPVHWGAFTLAFHAWTDPVERVVRAAGEKGVLVATPRIGEAVPVGAGGTPGAGPVPRTAWWREL